MLNTKALAASASASAAKVYVEDVFSTWLYDGNGSTQTITNGIDLSGKGGLVWIKSRTTANPHVLFDTARGANKSIRSNSTLAEEDLTSLAINGLTSFGSAGFTLGDDVGFGAANTSPNNYTSWTFRKAAKFFDVVTYTGNGNNRTISHNLGSVPGCIIIKRTDTTANWQVYHRSLNNTEYIVLNSTAAKATGTTRWNSTTPTSTEFSLGTDTTVNDNGGTYVAYLFAHDAGGFGDSGNDNVISCGSMTNAAPVNLGWEPQFVLLKRTDSTGSWVLLDTLRGFDSSTSSAALFANLSDAEGSAGYGWSLNATGFSGQAAGTFIYIAIRRGPMKTPTDATKVFQAKVYTGTNVDNQLVTTDILTDMVWARQRNDSVVTGMVVGDRLRGQPYLLTGSTAAEVDDADSFDQQLVSTTEYGTAFSSMTGFWVGNDATSKLNADTTSNNHVVHAFRRAPGFFDVVATTSTNSSNQRISHNLGVTPEFIIQKTQGVAGNWVIYAASQGRGKYAYFDALGFNSFSNVWGTADPSATDFGFASNIFYTTGTFLINYLFATCPGVSKVGSYTGTGTTKQIDCGFTNGARFVLIKRTDSTGDWYVWDAARGIVSGNDSYLLLNSTAAEVTNTDYIDPLSSGFEISSTAPAAINANGGSFIFLAVA